MPYRLLDEGRKGRAGDVYHKTEITIYHKYKFFKLNANEPDKSRPPFDHWFNWIAIRVFRLHNYERSKDAYDC